MNQWKYFINTWDHLVFSATTNPTGADDILLSSARVYSNFTDGGLFPVQHLKTLQREKMHYAGVIMQFITNNRFVYGAPTHCALSAAFPK